MLSDEIFDIHSNKNETIGNCTHLSTIIINLTLMLSATKHDCKTKLLSLEYTVSLETESILKKL